jgi:hypothetical protein
MYTMQTQDEKNKTQKSFYKHPLYACTHEHKIIIIIHFF